MAFVSVCCVGAPTKTGKAGRASFDPKRFEAVDRPRCVATRLLIQKSCLIVFTVPVQCPYSARTVPVDSARKEMNRDWARARIFQNIDELLKILFLLPLSLGFSNFPKESLRALSTGTVRALYGHCMGTVRALYSLCRVLKHISRCTRVGRNALQGVENIGKTVVLLQSRHFGHAHA